MYHNSSHKKFWIFDNEDALETLRCEANKKCFDKMSTSGKVIDYLNTSLYDISENYSLNITLTRHYHRYLKESMLLGRYEEQVLFRYYEKRLLDFCNAFKPTMPKAVVVRSPL